ncbi:uncharacterized protein [Phaenicophaeus curvirostris]|uniref:uncharacterized protein isoform X2 n=1 Tax=Phaenicophaeus curvirostris TaxID=33595 RepID=UPI0037F09845
MAGLETMTPRAKRPRWESRGDLGLSVPRVGARRRAKGWRTEGGGGQHHALQGWDPEERVLCPTLMPVTPGKSRLAKLHLDGECHGPASAPPGPAEREPASPPLQPCYKGTYFSGLPEDECQSPAAPSLLVPVVPTPSRATPRKTRSAPERTLVLELEGVLVCSSMLAGWRRGSVATITTSFQRDSYEVHVKLRPHVQQFLETLSKTYEIFIFTTAKQDYAEKVWDVLDPRKKLIRLPTGSRCRGGGGTPGMRSCCVSPHCWESSAGWVTCAPRSSGGSRTPSCPPRTRPAWMEGSGMKNLAQKGLVVLAATKDVLV